MLNVMEMYESKTDSKKGDKPTGGGRVDLIVGKFNQVVPPAPPPNIHPRLSGGANVAGHSAVGSKFGDLMHKLEQQQSQNRARSRSFNAHQQISTTSRKPLKSPLIGVKLPIPAMVSPDAASATASDLPPPPPHHHPRAYSTGDHFAFPPLPDSLAAPGGESGTLDRRHSSKSSSSSGFLSGKKSKMRKSALGSGDGNQNDPIEPGAAGDRLGVGGTRSPDHDHHDHHDDHDAAPTSSSSSKNKKKKDKKKSKAPSRHGSDAKNSDKVRNKLKKFIGKRPTFESLQERGIIKDAVFGCPLQKLCEKEQNNVPNFIQLCVKEVERRGLDVDGIYRVSGNLSHVQRLRYLIDRDETPDLSQPEWEDIHLITGALKMFLRELPQPVIPFEFFDKFIAACKIQVEDQRIKAMKDLVSCLPTHNKHTLKYLLQHFTRVVEHSTRNRMQVQNMAIVFGPTLLLKPPDANPTAASASGGQMAVYMVYQNQIIDTLLTEFTNIFTF